MTKPELRIKCETRMTSGRIRVAPPTCGRIDEAAGLARRVEAPGKPGGFMALVNPERTPRLPVLSEHGIVARPRRVRLAAPPASLALPWCGKEPCAPSVSFGCHGLVLQAVFSERRWARLGVPNRGTQTKPRSRTNNTRNQGDSSRIRMFDAQPSKSHPTTCPRTSKTSAQEAGICARNAVISARAWHACARTPESCEQTRCHSARASCMSARAPSSKAQTRDMCARTPRFSARTSESSARTRRLCARTRCSRARESCSRTSPRHPHAVPTPSTFRISSFGFDSDFLLRHSDFN